MNKAKEVFWCLVKNGLGVLATYFVGLVGFLFYSLKFDPTYFIDTDWFGTTIRVISFLFVLSFFFDSYTIITKEEKND